jgi:hypothetical protein
LVFPADRPTARMGQTGRSAFDRADLGNDPSRPRQELPRIVNMTSEASTSHLVPDCLGCHWLAQQGAQAPFGC